MRKVIVIAVAVILLGGGLGAGAYWYTHRDAETAGEFRTAQVTRGDIVSTISATGTVEPEEVVDVGAQVAGVILSFGTDANNKPIDYNSVVTENMVLARIDPALYQADLDAAQASLLQAQANVTRANADLVQKRALLDQATNDWKRAQALYDTKSGALADSAYDQYRANFEVAKDNVDIDIANIKVAEATVTQAQSALTKSKRNLGYCTITSPVKGTIIDRRVNIGQTVVSSLSAPSLFLIAKDLKRMQVWVSVNEADVGSIFTGQPVKFTVDAFSSEVFDGKVDTVRLNATMTQNVVTYTVEVATDNSSGTLLPYLTANAFFETGRRDKVLMVPNAALRWTPTAAQTGPQAESADTAGKDKEKAAAGGEQQTAKAASSAKGQTAKAAGSGRSGRAGGSRRTHGKVWVRDGATVRGIPVTVGLTDGVNTEISGEGLEEGLEVITGDVVAATTAPAAATSAGASPFTPQLPPRNRSGKGR
jgi:HlyD family secretion protein